MSKDSGGTYIQRLHALDLVTLADRIAPVSDPGHLSGSGKRNGSDFAPDQYKERGALLLAQGQIYHRLGFPLR